MTDIKILGGEMFGIAKGSLIMADNLKDGFYVLALIRRVGDTKVLTHLRVIKF